MKCAIVCGASFACGALGAIQLVVGAGCPDALMVLAWVPRRKLPPGTWWVSRGRKLLLEIDLGEIDSPGY